MYTRCISLFLYCLFAFQALAAGPFGFEYGMTKEQIVKLVGQRAVEKEDGDRLSLSTAPKPHPDFEAYNLMISPEQGLVKIGAVGRDVQTTGSGYELRRAFTETADALVKSYGSAKKTYDFLESGSIWKDSQYWMMGVKKKERHLVATWESPLPNHLQSIFLEVSALKTETGYLTLSYEFDGFKEYSDGKKAKAGSVF